MHCFEFSFALETCCINTCCEDEANHQRNFARKPDVIGSIINVVASTEPRALVGIPMVLIRFNLSLADQNQRALEIIRHYLPLSRVRELQR
jgi:hypothetical protein